MTKLSGTILAGERRPEGQGAGTGPCTTATLFNYSYRAQSGRNLSPAPESLRRIVIVGGGSAGWMTALTFARSLIERGVQITVLESPTVPIIGGGEGSTR